MRYVITYDISHDAIRLRVADYLGSWGSRVQESVFECTAGPDDLESMLAKLERLVQDDAAASVRVYRLCADCWGQALGIGSAITRNTTACTIV